MRNNILLKIDSLYVYLDLVLYGSIVVYEYYTQCLENHVLAFK